MNKDLLKRRYKELVPGTTHSCELGDLSEDLAICLKLTMENKLVTPQAVLVMKMETVLHNMKDSEPVKCFLQAIKELYEDKAKLCNSTKIETGRVCNRP